MKILESLISEDGRCKPARWLHFILLAVLCSCAAPKPAPKPAAKASPPTPRITEITIPDHVDTWKIVASNMALHIAVGTNLVNWVPVDTWPWAAGKVILPPAPANRYYLIQWLPGTNGFPQWLPGTNGFPKQP